ncbi:MAG: DJ-1/PfpI family protein [Chloroflexota bacterium]|nr:DJ-1/PfpI family protein [Chloroflexota bacterium]
MMIFVLWGTQFDEVPVTVFVSVLREAGLKVKIVGLHGQHITGTHGLAIEPDMRLGEALAAAPETECLVIPAGLRMLNQFRHDPRLAQLLKQVCTSDAKIVAGPGGDSGARDRRMLQAGDVEFFPPEEGIFEFARHLASTLQS